MLCLRNMHALEQACTFGIDASRKLTFSPYNVQPIFTEKTSEDFFKELVLKNGLKQY